MDFQFSTGGRTKAEIDVLSVMVLFTIVLS